MTKSLGAEQGTIARGVAIGFAFLLRVLAWCQRLLAFGTFQTEAVPILAKGSLALSCTEREGRRGEVCNY